LFSSTEKNNKNYLHFHKIGKKSSNLSRKFNFPAPRIPGDYVVKFFPALCGYTDVCKSNHMSVLSRDVLSVELSRDDLSDWLSFFTVSWKIFSVDISPYDYIALHAQNSDNYVAYKYVDIKKGNVVFPSTGKAGNYEFRYHSAAMSKYTHVVKSPVVEIPNLDKVESRLEGGNVLVTCKILSEKKTSWDWVGIYKKDTPSNTSYVTCKYVSMSEHVLVFELPKDPGEYEARYFLSRLGKYHTFLKSNIFVIE